MFEKLSPAVYRWAGLSLWVILAVGITITISSGIGSPESRTVVDIYRQASLNWIAGEPLYLMNGHGYLYLPQGAIVFLPWGILPATLCEFAWRWSIILIAAYSVFRMTKLFGGDPRYFFGISLGAVVLGMGSARIGQSTMMIMGLNILAVVELSEQRWWRATLFLMLAFAFKPLGLPLILLIAVLKPPMSYRLALGMAIVAVFPFLTQRPDYVVSQYYECVDNMKIAFQVGESEYWAQFFGMLKVISIEPPAFLKTLVRLVFALATLFACWEASRKLPVNRSAFHLIAFASVYLMLFHSRTEGNTYSMVGPIYGALSADALFRRRNLRTAIMIDVAIVITLLHYELGKHLTPVPREVWVSPFVCLFVTGYLVSVLISDIKSAALESAAPKELNEQSLRTREINAAA